MSVINHFNLKDGKLKSDRFNQGLDLSNTRTSGTDRNFQFKFVTEAELKCAVKKVRRANQRKRDEEVWREFVLKQERNNDDNIPWESKIVARDGSTCEECGRLELESTGSNKYKETPRVLDGEAKNECYQEPIYDVSHTYQPGPGLTKRLQDLLSTVRRMTSVLVNPCSQQFEDEDVDRTIKRSQEFDAMFARNHLYEIQRLLKGSKKTTAGKVVNTTETEAKISAALKCVTQALQVYTRHVSKGSRVKYQQVLPIFQSITAIDKLMERLTGQRSFPLRRDIDVSCSYMKQVLLEMSATETKTMSVISHKPAARVHHKHKPSADLSMYNRRQKAEWRKKSATLAHARFGPPNKKYRKPSLRGPGKEYFSKFRVDQTESDKFQDLVPSKDIPHRNATRAVPEETVATMMETIPYEPIEDGELSLDVKTFQALKQLQDKSNFTHCFNQLQEQAPFDLLETLSRDQLPPMPSPKPPKLDSPSKEKNLKNADATLVSAKSPERELNNVQLICLQENEHKPHPVLENTGEKVEEEKRTTLCVEEDAKLEILAYHDKITEFQKACPHYKGGKAVSIVDRLTNRILTEMVMDFQRNELDEVVQTLYNLEFQ